MSDNIKVTTGQGSVPVNKELALILFAKAPIAGKVKTRLMPQLSAEQATKVAEKLLEESIKLAVQAWPGRVVLAVWPNSEHPFLQKMLSQYSIEWMRQAAGDLGHKMHQAMRQQNYPCAVMGCDVPHCPPQVLRSVYQRLQEGESVLGPTSDGGYYLMGLQTPQPALFANVEWGTETVLDTTLALAKSQQLRFYLLPELNDIDTADDLEQAKKVLPSLL